MDAINPATGERVDSYDTHTEAEVDDALDAATDAFEDWSGAGIKEFVNRKTVWVE